jgi:hypothetical protein
MLSKHTNNNVIGDTIEYNYRDWMFGSYFCRVTNFMTHMSIIASVLTMAAIAMER